MQRRRERSGLAGERLRRAYEIDALAKERLSLDLMYYYRELAELPIRLEDEEEVVDLTWAHYLFSAGLLVLTQRRVIYLGYPTFIRWMLVRSFPLSDISACESFLDRKYGRLRIYLKRAWGEQMREFPGIDPRDSANRIEDEVCQLITQSECGE